jgi:hypothetical protein
MPALHAHLSPSGSTGWMACPGKLTLEAGLSDGANEHSDRGTACHWVAAECLEARNAGREVGASEYVGTAIVVSHPPEEKRTVEFTDDLADIAQVYIDSICRFAAGAELFVEQRVEFSEMVDMPDQFGTADAIVLKPLDGDVFELQLHDLKAGFRPVEVIENKQLRIYALGALHRFEISHDITSIRLFIHQPRLYKEPSEWTCTVDELREFAVVLKAAAKRVDDAKHDHNIIPIADWNAFYLNPKPNDKDCAYCKVMATCPSYAKMVVDTVSTAQADINDFPVDQPTASTPVSDLAFLWGQVDAIEDWCLAVRAEIERRLIDAKNDPAVIDALGCKLVLGRGGPRKWMDPEKAEDYLRKTVRIKVEDTYNLKLKSPTQIEDQVVKAKKMTDRQWGNMQYNIVRTPAKLSVAKASDKRPAAVVQGVDENAFPTEDITA